MGKMHIRLLFYLSVDVYLSQKLTDIYDFVVEGKSEFVCIENSQTK